MLPKLSLAPADVHGLSAHQIAQSEKSPMAARVRQDPRSRYSAPTPESASEALGGVAVADSQIPTKNVSNAIRNFHPAKYWLR